MRRKVIQLAGKTLVVSIPSKWAKSHGLKKGDEVELTDSGDTLELGLTKKHKIKSIKVDVSQCKRRTLNWTLSSIHKQGYDEMEVCFKTQEQLQLIENRVQDLFIGFAIVEQQPSKVLIKAVAIEEAEEYQRALRRAFRVTISMGNSIVEAFKQNNAQELKNLLRLEKTNNQLTNFCERLINKNLTHPKTRTFEYVIAWNLEKVADELKYICEKVECASDEAIEYLQNAIHLLDKYHDLHYSFSSESLETTAQQLKQLWERGYTLIKKDPVLIHHAMKLIAQVADFSASMIALQDHVVLHQA